MPQPYITDTCSEGVRKITVLNGQPYYQSTGRNSGSPGFWLPFTMVKGNLPIDLDKLPPYFDRFWTEQFLYDFNYPGVFIKINETKESLEIEEKALFPLIKETRIPFKHTLVASSRLGGGKQFEGKYFEAAGLDDSQKIEARKPIIFENKPEHEYGAGDEDKLNIWLINQGATVVKTLLHDSAFSLNDIQPVSIIEKLSLPIKECVDQTNKQFSEKIKLSDIDSYYQYIASLNQNIQPLLDEKNDFTHEKIDVSIIVNILKTIQHDIDNLKMKCKSEATSSNTYQFFSKPETVLVTLIIDFYKKILDEIIEKYAHEMHPKNKPRSPVSTKSLNFTQKDIGEFISEVLTNIEERNMFTMNLLLLTQ